MGLLVLCRSLIHHLTRLGIIGAVPALLVVLAHGTLDVVHPAGPQEAPTVSMGGAQSEPVTPRAFEGDLRQMRPVPPWRPGDPVREVPRPRPQPRDQPQNVPQPPQPQPQQVPLTTPQAQQDVDVFPSIRYAGRLASDPRGTLPQGEGVILDGAFAQTGISRWGDYSAMTVDPADDCTFWYTQEYVATDDPHQFGTGTWGTRIATLRFPSCAGGDFTTPVLNVEGIAFTGAGVPDTVGDVGPHHYIQMVNDGVGGGSVFAIYDKAGTRLVGPVSLQSLWTGGGACASGAGDPIVLYDRLADRWLMSEFPETLDRLCVYISRTPDPISGGWFLYDFATPGFPDYPKYAVWPDAYYVSSTEISSGVAPVPAAYALDRRRMLTGQPATLQRFAAPLSLLQFVRQDLLPSDLDGATPPPAGSPNYFMRHRDDEVHGASTDGVSTPTLLEDAPWPPISIDLSAALGSSNVVLRFAFNTGDATGNAFEGFHVDDVVVTIDGTPVFTDDFESGAAGWTGTGLWHLTTACSAALEEFNHSAPTTFYYGQDATCDFDTGGANAGTLDSPVLDLSGSGTQAVLSFMYFLRTDRACPLDDVRVQLSTDGGATFTDVIGNCVAVGDPTADFLEIWEFRVDFANPTNSTFRGPTLIRTAEFDADLCGVGFLVPEECIPQAGAFTRLEALNEWLMWRLQYRNFGSHETLVGNFTVDVDGTDHGGIRWFELRKTAGAPWTLFQEGTHAPDPAHRWMGSIAMDKDGNIALGYSVSAGNPDPNEPNNTLAQATPIPCPFTGPVDTSTNIHPLGDVDFYAFEATAGERVLIDINAQVLGAPLVSVLGLFDRTGTLLASTDPLGGGDPFLFFILPSTGTFVIGVASGLDVDFNGGQDAFSTGPYTLSVTCLPSLPPPAPGALLGATGFLGRALIDIDPTTGTSTMRASQGAFDHVNELEFRADGTLFGATGAFNGHIITIDPVTGSETLVGTHTSGAVYGLEFVDSTLYGTFVPFDGPPANLVTVDQTTGALTVIGPILGPIGFPTMGGLAFDTRSRTMYGITFNNLITIDLATGAGTLVGPIGFDDVAALEFGPDGILYGGISGALGASSDAGSLISIDPTTGVGTLIGPTGFPSLDGLAFVPSPPAKVWIGLKNSDAVGLRLDLRAEVFLNGAKIGEGQFNNVASGSSGFNNAKLNTIPLAIPAPVEVVAEAELEITLSVRRTCFGGGHNSGTPRLWFNDSQANSRFGATIEDTSSEFFLREGFVLNTSPGASKKVIAQPTPAYV